MPANPDRFINPTLSPDRDAAPARHASNFRGQAHIPGASATRIFRGRGESMIHLEYIDRHRSVQTVPVICMHCEQPTCAEVCPADAIKRTADGVVQSARKPRCIACGSRVVQAALEFAWGLLYNFSAALRAAFAFEFAQAIPAIGAQWANIRNYNSAQGPLEHPQKNREQQKWYAPAQFLCVHLHMVHLEEEPEI